jgi:hypothetical protein
VKKVGWEKVLENTGLIIMALYLFLTSNSESNFADKEVAIENS